MNFCFGLSFTRFVGAKRYKLLNKYIGQGVSTQIVLWKCLLDQIFFATQQDVFFLGLCAIDNFDKLQDAISEVHRTFLTTWIMDCSMWPLVNFVGFAAVPFKLQPTYMAIVQFFWQIYISSIASSGKQFANTNNLQVTGTSEWSTESDLRIEQLFNTIDIDKVRYSAFIHYVPCATELSKCFKNLDQLVA
jgi:hypothetical protein